MTEVSPSLSVTTVNVNVLNSQSKTEIARMAKNTSSNCILSPGDSLEIQSHKQVETKRIEKDIPCKQ